MHAATDSLARFFFITFIYLTDNQKNVTPSDIELLQELLNDTRWCDGQLVVSGVLRLREKYSEFWEAYESGQIAVDVDILKRELKMTQGAVMASEIPEVRRSIESFVRKFEQTRVSALNRLGLHGSAVAREQGRTIINLFSEVMTNSPDVESIEVSRNVTRQMPVEGRSSNGATLNSFLTGGGENSETSRMAIGVYALPVTQPRIASANGASNALTPWDGRSIDAYCVAIVQETADTKTYVFASENVELFNYRPGQFVALEIDVGDRVLRRCYTISSSPSRPRTLSITVKRVPKGWMSNWLFENMTVHMRCTISGPYGDFHLDCTKNDRLLMLAAGSGITPIISMLRWMVDISDKRDVIVINSVRTPADIIFSAELNLMASRSPTLRIFVIPSATQGSGWTGLHGRISGAMLNMLVPDLLSRDAYVCGPEGYMRLVTKTLADTGFPADRLFQENFDVATKRPSPRTKLAESGDSVVADRASNLLISQAEGNQSPPLESGVSKEIEAPGKSCLVFTRSATDVVCDNGTVLLDAAEDHGVALVSGCRSGVCGMCRVRKIEGNVRMPAQRALSAMDLEEGYVLACVARVYGRVVVDQ